MKQSKNGIIKRIRFHGRGGQGMKTASRIVGTDACAIIMVKHNQKQTLVYFEYF
jgi:Pyruvate/2-oxoacid:ferredoxin oxidoreductase gamma subunit